MRRSVVPRRLLAATVAVWFVACMSSARADIYLSSYGNSLIFRYTDDGQYVSQFGSGIVGKPLGIDFGPDGNLYVASSQSDTIEVFSPVGAYLGTYVSGGISFGFDLEFGPDDNLYLSDRDANAVLRFEGPLSTSPGAALPVSGETGAIFVHAAAAKGITFGPDGNLYTSDGASTISRYTGPGTGEGAALPAAGQSGATFATESSSVLNSPRGLTFGSDGNLYVACNNSDNVTRYDGTTGTLIGQFGDAAKATGNVKDGMGLTFTSSGDLLVASQSMASASTQQVSRFDSSGNLLDAQYGEMGNAAVNATGQPAYMAYRTTGLTPALPVADGLKLWLSADSGVVTDAGGVTEWIDQSGLGNGATQTDDARKPVLVADAINGKPVLRFTNSSTNAQDDRLDGPEVITGDSGRTIILVTKENIDSTGNYSIVEMNRDGGGNGEVYRVTPETAVRNIGGGAVYANHPLDQNYRILTVQNPEGANTNNVTATLDGIKLTLSGTAADNPLNGIGGYRIGDAHGNGGAAFTGDIAEMLVFDRQLTAAEQNAVGYYLETKYGLSTSYVPTANQDKPVKVFLLAGQSNMRGHGDPALLGADDQQYNDAQGDVMFWYKPNNFTEDSVGWPLLQTGSGRTDTTSTGGFGPELTFGEAIADAYPDERIAIIKHGPGGTNLYSQWDPNSGSVYADFLDTTYDALAQLTADGLEYEIAGMLWMQGEADASRTQAQYEADLTEFIAAVRDEFGDEKLPFVIGRLSDRTAYASVRDAQVAVADLLSYVEWIDTDSLPKKSDDVHYTTDGQLTLGQLFADGYFLAAVPEPSTYAMLASLALAGLAMLVRRKFRR